MYREKKIDELRRGSYLNKFLKDKGQDGEDFLSNLKLISFGMGEIDKEEELGYDER